MIHNQVNKKQCSVLSSKIKVSSSASTVVLRHVVSKNTRNKKNIKHKNKNMLINLKCAIVQNIIAIKKVRK